MDQARFWESAGDQKVHCFLCQMGAMLRLLRQKGQSPYSFPRTEQFIKQITHSGGNLEKTASAPCAVPIPLDF